MLESHKAPIRAVLTLIGTIIGAGIFGIPAMMGRTGIVMGSVIFWCIALLVLAVHLFYVELIEHDGERRRLPGYLGEILGKWAKKITVCVYSGQLIGASFAYVLLGGGFLAAIASNLDFAPVVWVWQIFFWLGGIITVAVGLKLVSKVESALTWGLIALMFIMICFALSKAQTGITLSWQWNSLLAPIGIFLFALSGTTVIPEIHEITRRNSRITKQTVTIGTLIAAFLTWVFGVAVYAALPFQGMAQHPESLTAVFPSSLWWILPALGFLAVITSFITAAFDLQATYRIDFGISRRIAWAITLGAPLLLLLITSRDFIRTIDTVGSLFTATTDILIVSAAIMLFRKKPTSATSWWRMFVASGIIFVLIIVIIQRLSPFLSF